MELMIVHWIKQKYVTVNQKGQSIQSNEAVENVFIHLGGDVIIRSKEIIAILNGMFKSNHK